MNSEEWRPVVGFETHYLVSNRGRIKRTSKTTRTEKEYILGSKTSHGYRGVTFTVGGKCYSRYLHRVLAAAFLPNPDNCGQINHIDGDKENNALSNIEWVTPLQNTHHAKRHGLNPPNTARLSLAQVEEIRAILIADTSRSIRSIGRQFGVTHSSIARIRDGRSYKWSRIHPHGEPTD